MKNDLIEKNFWRRIFRADNSQKKNYLAIVLQPNTYAQRTLRAKNFPVKDYPSSNEYSYYATKNSPAKNSPGTFLSSVNSSQADFLPNT
jgi:hypothetical protein